MPGRRNRPDHDGNHRRVYEKNRKRIFMTQTLCGICGRPVDFTLRYPDPGAACIDHIIPIDKGGHPSDINNLQLAHAYCNRQKSDKLYRGTAGSTARDTGNTVKVNDKEKTNKIQLSRNWGVFTPDSA